MPDGILDDLGLVRENNFLVLSFPQWKGILPFHITGRVNKGYEKINYGPLNITGTVSTVAGVCDGGTSSGAFSFNWAILPQEFRADMFWYDKPERLLHVKKLDIAPFTLRKYMWLTQGVQQASFLREAPADPRVPSDFGFWRGTKELMFLPYMHVQFEVANMTNMDLYTYARMIYGEYLVKMVVDPDLVFALMSRKGDYEIRNAYWFTFPGETRFVEEPFQRGYKIIQPFPIRTRMSELRSDIENIIAGKAVAL